MEDNACFLAFEISLRSVMWAHLHTCVIWLGIKWVSCNPDSRSLAYFLSISEQLFSFSFYFPPCCLSLFHCLPPQASPLARHDLLTSLSSSEMLIPQGQGPQWSHSLGLILLPHKFWQIVLNKYIFTFLTHVINVQIPPSSGVGRIC